MKRVELAVDLGTAIGSVKASVFFETFLVAISDSLAYTDNVELVSFVAPFAFSYQYSLLFDKLIHEVGLSVL